MTCSQHVVINTNDPSSLAQSDQVPAQHDAVQSHHGQWTGQDSSAAPQEEVEMIISMTHEEEMVWNTDMDSNDSDVQSCTSTPEPKGVVIHHWLRPGLGKKSGRKETNFNSQVVILADARSHHWPQDNGCKIEYHPDWSLQKWLEGLCAEIIRVACHTAVTYFEKT